MGAFAAMFVRRDESRDGQKENVNATRKNEPGEVVSTDKPVEISNRACFGAGCYWGTEKYFRYDFPKLHKNGSVYATAVGFMGPKHAKRNPSYREVCSGRTGHVEVFDFAFSGGAEYYSQLVHYFFQFHDPTTLNRQGNDKGTQYASVIYCYDQQQFEIATRVKHKLQQLLNEQKLNCYSNNIVDTDIRMCTTFYPADEEHQNYLMENPGGYCNHRLRFTHWPK